MSAKILVIDDEPSARKTIEHLLFGEDYDMQFADNGPTGLAYALAWQPDVVLCDVMMPGMDGFEVCRRVRAEPAIAQVPFILITALSDRESKVHGLAAGADDFLSKPVDQAELRARLRTTVQLNRFRRIEQSRAQLRRVLEHSEEGYLILDAANHLQFANARAKRYLGLSDPADALPAASFMDLAQCEYELHPTELWRDWARVPADIPLYLVRPETPTARAFWLEVKRLTPRETTIAEQVIWLRDVTSQVVAASQWASFAQVLSHKLRTPVGHIYGLLEILHQMAQDEAASEQGEIISLAYTAAVRLKDELADILQYVQAPGLAAAEQDFPIQQFESVLTHTAQALNVPITTTIDPAAATLHVPMSEQTVIIIAWEILENALKFHPQRRPQVEVTVTCERDLVRLCFADDGLTLSPEQLERAWMPFYQAEKISTGEVAGTGLGLAVVALLVWTAGGRCYLYNRRDKAGVMVDLHLPIKAVAQAAP